MDRPRPQTITSSLAHATVSVALCVRFVEIICRLYLAHSPRGGFLHLQLMFINNFPFFPFFFFFNKMGDVLRQVHIVL